MAGVRRFGGRCGRGRRCAALSHEGGRLAHPDGRRRGDAGLGRGRGRRGAAVRLVRGDAALGGRAVRSVRRRHDHGRLRYRRRGGPAPGRPFVAQHAAVVRGHGHRRLVRLRFSPHRHRRHPAVPGGSARAPAREDLAPSFTDSQAVVEHLRRFDRRGRGAADGGGHGTFRRGQSRPDGGGHRRLFHPLGGCGGLREPGRGDRS